MSTVIFKNIFWEGFRAEYWYNKGGAKHTVSY